MSSQSDATTVGITVVKFSNLANFITIIFIVANNNYDNNNNNSNNNNIL